MYIIHFSLITLYSNYEETIIFLHHCFSNIETSDNIIALYFCKYKTLFIYLVFVDI